MLMLTTPDPSSERRGIHHFGRSESRATENFPSGFRRGPGGGPLCSLASLFRLNAYTHHPQTPPQRGGEFHHLGRSESRATESSPPDLGGGQGVRYALWLRCSG